MKQKQSSMQQKRNQKLLKRVALLIFCVFLAVACIAGILALVLHMLQKTSGTTSDLPSDAFYAANYDENIFENPDYLRFDQSVMYLEYGSGETLTEENHLSLGVASSFFYDYFQAIIGGNVEAYKGLLTEEYIRRYNPPERFTMQMLYDIEVNQLQNADTVEYHGETVTAYYFSVKYKIFQNNGTFRRDVGSNRSTTQYYELYRIDGKLYLNAISNKQIHRPS